MPTQNLKSAAAQFLALGKQAQVEAGGLTTIRFKMSTLQLKAAKSGNTGYRVTTPEGNSYTFWKSQLEADENLIEQVDADTFQITGKFSDAGALITNGGNFWD